MCLPNIFIFLKKKLKMEENYIAKGQEISKLQHLETTSYINFHVRGTYSIQFRALNLSL